MVVSDITPCFLLSFFLSFSRHLSLWHKRSHICSDQDGDVENLMEIFFIYTGAFATCYDEGPFVVDALAMQERLLLDTALSLLMC